jgi:two-component system phosphate regulon sensor histidine kinase PhoR
MFTKDDQIEELIEQNDELENYFGNTIIPQLFVDGDLILQKFTPPAMPHFKLSKEDIGKPIVDVKDNFRFPSIIDNIQHVLDSNEILEKEIQTTDRRWYQMNIIPYVEFKSKRTNGVIITFVEITRRIKDLKEQETLISDHETLLDTISHDIKSPLTSLVTAIDLFKKVPPDKPHEFESLLNVLESSIRKMQKIILELTDTRQEEYKYKAQEELLNFEHIIEDVRMTIMDNIEASGAMINCEINVSEITFSRRKLRSIIYNLVSNAIKYRSPDRSPKIVIKTTKVDNSIIISVKDNGLGIDESKREAIFSKYYRVEHAIEGTGVGLYLVKEIVVNSGGTISVESEFGIGSEFLVTLKAP